MGSSVDGDGSGLLAAPRSTHAVEQAVESLDLAVGTVQLLGQAARLAAGRRQLLLQAAELGRYGITFARVRVRTRQSSMCAVKYSVEPSSPQATVAVR